MATSDLRVQCEIILKYSGYWLTNWITFGKTKSVIYHLEEFLFLLVNRNFK